MASRFELSVVVTTLGKVDIRPLLESLALQTVPPHQVVVNDQGEGEDVRRALAEYADRLNVLRTTSERGASKGRNAALVAMDVVDGVFFTDDDCQLAVDVLERTRAAFERGLDLVTGRLVSSHGARGLGRVTTETPLTKKNVWTLAIEPAMGASKRVLQSHGGYDDRLGVGGHTKYQSGEGTDLLLRAIADGMRVAHDPSITVIETATPLTQDELLRKTLTYARGTGRVYASHYSLKDRALVILRPLAGAGVRLGRGDIGESRRLFNAARGRLSALGRPGARPDESNTAHQVAIIWRGPSDAAGS